MRKRGRTNKIFESEKPDRCKKCGKIIWKKDNDDRCYKELKENALLCDCDEGEKENE